MIDDPGGSRRTSVVRRAWMVVSPLNRVFGAGKGMGTRWHGIRRYEYLLYLLRLHGNSSLRIVE